MSDKEKSTPTPSTSAAEKIASSEGEGTGKNYDRGENQKPTTDAYRDNWDNIFGKKKKKARKKK
jgi:hypothetical protein